VKIALIMAGGEAQISLTGETDAERAIVRLLKEHKEASIIEGVDVFHTRGDYWRQATTEYSVCIILKQAKP